MRQRRARAKPGISPSTNAEDAGALLVAKRHVVVDGRELVGRPTGVGRYLMGLLTEWARTPREDARITVIVPGEVPAELAALSPSVTVEQVAASGTGTIFEQTALPGIARRLNADIFFAPAYTAPLRLPCPFVVAIHDLSYFAHPEWFTWREGLRRRWITRAAAKRARAIVTISEFSAGELGRYLGVARTKIVLAPPGPPGVKGSRGPGQAKTVLFVGSLFPRRRVPELIASFATVAREVPDARLVIVGDNRSTPPIDPEAIAASAGVGDRVDWLRYVSDETLETMYAQARVFAFLSDYEGFAMTPMEAIAQGVPVVLADTAVGREIYGAGATYVRPGSPELASALTTLLTDDSAHASAQARGVERLSAYSWAESARLVWQALS
jgi:glycosyltransferase involved in cell wall biosynthesis